MLFCLCIVVSYVVHEERVLQRVKNILKYLANVLPKRSHTIMLHLSLHVVEDSYLWGANSNMRISERMQYHIKSNTLSRNMPEHSLAKNMAKNLIGYPQICLLRETAIVLNPPDGELLQTAAMKLHNHTARMANVQMQPNWTNYQLRHLDVWTDPVRNSMHRYNSDEFQQKQIQALLQREFTYNFQLLQGKITMFCSNIVYTAMCIVMCFAMYIEM